MHLAQEKNLTRPTNSKGWIVNCFINPNTAIVQVTLPYFIPGQMPGARQARDTVLKVTASRNNDSQVLHFHSEHNDLGEKDVYYSYAPGWTNVSGGRRPRLLCSPAQVCEWVTDAAQCAPLITETKYFIVNKDGRKNNSTFVALFCAKTLNELFVLLFSFLHHLVVQQSNFFFLP